MTITDPAVSAHADATIGLFEITDHITIDSTQGAHTVEMWCPVIGDGAFQRVLDVEVTSEDPYDLTREPEFGNLMLYSRLRLATAASWSIRYVVERRCDRACSGSGTGPPVGHGAIVQPRLDPRSTCRCR